MTAQPHLGGQPGGVFTPLHGKKLSGVASGGGGSVIPAGSRLRAYRETCWGPANHVERHGPHTEKNQMSDPCELQRSSERVPGTKSAEFAACRSATPCTAASCESAAGLTRSWGHLRMAAHIQRPVGLVVLWRCLECPFLQCSLLQMSFEGGSPEVTSATALSLC